MKIVVYFITKLPKSKAGNHCIVTIVYLLTKRVHCTHTTEMDLPAETLAKLQIRGHIRLYGMLKSIVSDRGPQFVVVLLQRLANSVGIDRATTTAYHQQADGQTGRANQVIGPYLRRYSTHKPEEWEQQVSLGEFVYNSSTHSATRTSPCELDLGYTPPMPLDRTLPARSAVASPVALPGPPLAERLEQSLRPARNRLAQFQDAMKEKMNSGLRPSSFAMRQSVWLKTDHLPLTRANNSL